MTSNCNCHLELIQDLQSQVQCLRSKKITCDVHIKTIQDLQKKLEQQKGVGIECNSPQGQLDGYHQTNHGLQSPLQTIGNLRTQLDQMQGIEGERIRHLNTIRDLQT